MIINFEPTKDAKVKIVNRPKNTVLFHYMSRKSSEVAMCQKLMHCTGPRPKPAKYLMNNKS